jgi:flavin-dependent dehydrogenase
MQYAVDAGAELYPNTTLKTITHKSDHLEIETDKGILNTRFIIGADGARSLVAKCMGWKETRYLIPAVESEVYLDQAELDQFSASTRFDFDIITNGYAWVFPKSGHLSIGLCCSQRGKSKLKTNYTEYMQLLNISSTIREEMHGFVIPVSPRTDGFTRDRTLLVGDAAGFADPITAEGISFAVYSGQLAAQALIDADFDEKNAFVQYEKYIAQNLLPEIKAAKWLAKLLYSPPKFRNLLFKTQGDRMTASVGRVFTGEDSYQQIMHRHLPMLRLLGFPAEKPGFVN